MPFPRVFLTLLLAAPGLTPGVAVGSELRIVIDGGSGEGPSTVVLTEPRPSTTALDGLAVELGEVLEAVVVRGRDGLLRAVKLEDCDVIERIQRHPPRFALALRDSRVIEGEILTVFTGRSRNLQARVLPEQISTISWSRRPGHYDTFEDYFADIENGAPSENESITSESHTATVHLRAGPGRVAFGLALERVWFAFLDDGRGRPIYRGDLTLGHLGKTPARKTPTPGLVRGPWEVDVDLAMVRRVTFHDRGPLLADVEVAGEEPFLDAEVFGRWAATRDLREALYLMGLDSGVLHVIPIGEIEALSRPAATAPVHAEGSDEGRWEVTVADGRGTRTFAMDDPQPLSDSPEPLLQELMDALGLVVLARPDGSLMGSTVSRVRRAHREGDDMVFILTDQRPIEGRWLGALEGWTAYGAVLLDGASIHALVTSNQGRSGPIELGWSSDFSAQVGKRDGTRRDLDKATWLLVPDVTELDGSVGTSRQLALYGPGWVDRIDLASILALGRNPHASSPAWRVSLSNGPAMFGEISAVPEDCFARLEPRQEHWSVWIGGVSGAAVHFLPMDAVESLTIQGQRPPTPTKAWATLDVRGAVPPQRQVTGVRPVVDGRRAPALFEMGAAVHGALVLEDGGGLSTLVPLDAVDRLLPDGPGRTRVLVLLPRHSVPAEVVGKLLSGLEGRTAYGRTCISAEALGGYLPLGSEEMDTHPWQKVTSLTDLHIRLRDGTSVELDFTFFADDVRQGEIRLPVYAHEFVLDTGVEETWTLADLQEAHFEEIRDPRSPLRGRLRRADKPALTGEVKLLSRVGDDAEYGVPDEGDLVCGLRGGLVRCVGLRQIESLVRK